MPNRVLLFAACFCRLLLRTRIHNRWTIYVNANRAIPYAMILTVLPLPQTLYWFWELKKEGEYQTTWRKDYPIQMGGTWCGIHY